MGKEKKLIVVGGPTASGKTSLAIEIASLFETEIISADSRQFYREMNIGTAKPTSEELTSIPHHLVGHLSILQDYTVADFERDALKKLEEIFEKNEWAVLVGGSGFFIQTICEGLDDLPKVDPAIKNAWQEQFESKGIKFLQDELAAKDPDYLEKVDPQNPARLIRALSFFQAHEQPISTFLSGKRKKRNFQTYYLSLYWPRDMLYERINQRVDNMMEVGLLEEARGLLPQRGQQALATVGYQELFSHLDGKLSVEEAVTLIKQNSRRYAKRQMTWMRKQNQWRRCGNKKLALSFVDWLKNGGTWSTSKEKDRLEILMAGPEGSGNALVGKKPGGISAMIKTSGPQAPFINEQFEDQVLSISEGKKIFWNKGQL
ncbi:MAG: tRNA (adenosine(37)-N6)-dimethylallyltransferase MiaA [Saprospiraceae bacterium]|nr:tRNA (adenosine(37)-N6)-dimethylallyltransferase MiaA [Saprospiraceae bacterium]